MTETSRLPALGTERDAPVYRPLSGLAVAGLGLALLYSLGLLIVTARALSTGVPLQLHPASLVLPLTAAALSVAGWVQISRSEGTRSGLKLAQWGLGLSALFGLGSLVSNWAREYALWLEVTPVTNSWLEDLRQGKHRPLDLSIAFWNTLETDRRALPKELVDPEFARFLEKQQQEDPQSLELLQTQLKARQFDANDPVFQPLRQKQPQVFDLLKDFLALREHLSRQGNYDLNNTDFQKLLLERPRLFALVQESFHRRYFTEVNQRGKLPYFLDHDLVQLVRHAGEDATIEAVSLRKWDYERSGYVVEVNYRITTPEGVFEAVVALGGREGQGGEGRQWQVLLQGTGFLPPSPQKLTPLGRGVLKLRNESREFSREWARKLGQARMEDVYLDTRPELGLRALGRQAPVRGVVAVVGAGAASWSGVVGAVPLGDPDLVRRALLPGYADFLAGKLVRAADLMTPTDMTSDAILEEVRSPFGRQGKPPVAFLQVAEQPFGLFLSPWRKEQTEVVFLQPFDLRLGSYRCEGFLEVASHDPELLQWFNQSKAGNPGELGESAGPGRWRITSMDVTRGFAAAPHGMQER